jgi:hypothetical protein
MTEDTDFSISLKTVLKEKKLINVVPAQELYSIRNKRNKPSGLI